MYPSSSFGSGSNNNIIFTPNKPFGVNNGGSVFGGTTTGVFGQQGFGVSSTPNKPFGGSREGSFFSGTSTGVFGLQGFGVSSTPTPALAPSSPIFGVPSIVGVSSQPASGLTSAGWKFGQTQQTPALSWGQNQPKFPSIFTTKTQPETGFGKIQSVSEIGKGQFAFGVQNRANGDQVSSRGSRVASYKQTPGDGGKFMSISAMQVYQDKSHEELRWDDYELGVSVTPPVSHSNPFNILQPSTPKPSAANPFTLKPFEFPSTSNTFAPKRLEASTSNTFTPKPFEFPSTSNSFAPKPLETSTSNPFTPKPSEFPSTLNPFALKPLEAPSTPNPPAPKPFEFPSTSNPVTPKPFEAPWTPKPFEFPSTSNPVTTKPFEAPWTPKPFENIFKCPKPVEEPSPNPLPKNPLSPNSTPAPFTNPNQGQTPATTDTVVMPHLTPVSNPFGTLPDMPQLSIGRSRSSTPIQYGISSIPVSDKPIPSRSSPLLHDRTRVSSLLSSRRLSQRRIRVPAKIEAHQSKIPFYVDEGLTMTPSADIGIKPREDPRAYIISQTEKLHIKENLEKTSPLIGTQSDNDGVTENGSNTQSPNVVQEEQSNRNKEPGVDIDALLPKLNYADYYTKPAIQELAIKEKAEPGFCHRVKDFVIGRHGYGSINFIGETDIQGLELEELVQFNSREVIVYMDDNKKPPVGQGLNKPAVVTLLNIKFFDKKTGQQYTEGPKVERCKEILVKKTQDQGAQFVSYDALKGEWKFKVGHF